MPPIRLSISSFVIRPASRREGFSLIEMTVVLLVMSVVLAGVLPLLAERTDSQASDVTEERIKTIENAISAFATARDRLPCPANNKAPLDNQWFGSEVLRTGTTAPYCDFDVDPPDINPDVNNNASGDATAAFAAGGVPVKELGLSDDYAFDGWGRRFTYYVEARLTQDLAIDGTSDPTAPYLEIRAAGGTPRETGAVYSVLSHGPSGHGAYLRSGSRQAAGITNAEEWENCACNGSAGAGTFDDIIVQRSAVSSTSLATRYDDIVRYRTLATLNLGTGSGGTTSADAPENAVQYNVGSSFHGDDDGNFLWDETANLLTVGTAGHPSIVTMGFGSRLGIGTDAPDAVINFIGDGGVSDDMHIYAFSDTTPTWAPGLFLFRARGTQGSPSPILGGDSAGRLGFSGHHSGTSYTSVAYLEGVAEQTFTAAPTTQDGALIFATTRDASPAERMRIMSDGRVRVNVVGPAIAQEIPTGFELVADNVGPPATSDHLDNLAVTTYGTAGTSTTPSVLLRKAEGTRSAPLPLTFANGSLGGYHFRAWDGAGFVDVASVNAEIEQTYNSGDATTKDGALIFRTTLDNVNADRMRITSAGNVGVGAANPTSRFQINNDGGTDAQDDLAIYTYSNGANTTPALLLYRSPGTFAAPLASGANQQLGGVNFYGHSGDAGIGFQPAAYIQAFTETAWSANAADRDGRLLFSTMLDGIATTQLIISSAGNVEVAGSVTADSFLYSSDERLKTDIDPVKDEMLQSILTLEPVRYYLKEDTKKETRRLGFIAQAVQKQFPELVKASEDGMLSLDYAGLTVPLTKAVQELAEQQKALETRVAALENTAVVAHAVQPEAVAPVADVAKDQEPTLPLSQALLLVLGVSTLQTLLFLAISRRRK